MENGEIFGSNVWSAAVNIMSSFIHNEPTSFQVVNEAGLVKSLLGAVVPWELDESNQDETKLEDMPITLEYKEGELQYPTPSGILPSTEAMCEVPTAFGAICLNEAGMKLFLSSKAILKFMDIFVSPQHVKVMEEDGTTATSIGQTFDELSRHHPQLKDQIMFAVVAMVKRVGELTRYLAEHDGAGAKLWERTPSGIVVSGGRQALAGPNSRSGEEKTDATEFTATEEPTQDYAPGLRFIAACFKFLDGFFHNSNMCSYFCEQGGVEYLLDLSTAASNPYDLVGFPIHNKIVVVLKTMCEAKPHLVLPSLIRRTQLAIEGLKPLVENHNPAGAFATFSDLSKPQISSLPGGADGTTVVKSLAMMHTVTKVLGHALAPPQFTSRHSHQTSQLFIALNFTDVYVELVNELSQLHAACIWESLNLQKALPEKWKQSTDPRPYMIRRTDANGRVEFAGELRSDSQTNGEMSNGTSTPKQDSQEDILALKNMRTVRYLLHQAPAGIEAFFLSLGHSLMPKRASESQKQYATYVADHLAKAYVWELEYKKFAHSPSL
jgi:E3 ubiquitin-protein ligase HUWE1